MTGRIAGTLVAWIFASLIFHAAQQQPPIWNNPASQVISGVAHETFHSTSMRVEVGYNILLPPGYESEQRRYPVVYWLPGMGGNENSDVDQIAPQVMAAMHTGALPSLIIVFVNAADFTFYVDSPDKTILAERAFISELIPHIDATYRTLPQRKTRAVQGMSMGGFGALVHAMKHVNLFGSVVAYAPSLLEVQKTASGPLSLVRAGDTYAAAGEMPPALVTKLSNVFQRMFDGRREIFDQYSPWTIVSRDASRLRSELPVRIVIGTADGLWNANRLFHELMLKNNYLHEFEVIEGVGHNLGPLYAAVGIKGMSFHVKAGGW